jgi:DNA (cytosine-5)-methyltransferase 1
MTVGSLFAGIGGFDLGFERAGYEIKWQVEIDDYCQRVLAKHWPHVRRYGDIRAIDWSTVEPVDVLCGGFPCQPHSLAGARRASSDDRDLWGEFARAIRGVRPRWVVAENVPGLLSSESGRFFGRVLGDLAASGYDAEWDCIPAVAVGAPHRRDRVWIVAHAVRAGGREDTGGAHANESAYAWRSSQDDHQPPGDGESDRSRIVADDSQHRRRSRRSRRSDSGSEGQSKQTLSNMANAQSECGWPGLRGVRSDQWDAESCNDRRGRGGSDWWAVEPNVGRVAHGVPARVDRLRGLGNAIVPQIAEWIAHRITEAEMRAA